MKKAIAGVALLLAAICADANASDATQLRFGVDPTYAPFESKAPSGQLVGFDIDIGNEICRRLNVKCVWVETAFDGIIPALQGRKFEAVLSAMSITPQREAQLDFSTPLINTPSRLIGRRGRDIKPTVDSLRGKRVGVAQGSTQEAYAKAYWAPAGIDVVSYANQEQVYTDLRSGRIDATLTDMISGSEGFLKTPQGSDYAFLGEPVNDEKTLGKGVAIGLRKGDAALRGKIDSAIDSMVKDGTYRKIGQRYFDFDISKP
ncbi:MULTISPECIES: ABC transporter substrate-binding protein [Burkholderiaceae]|jgi:lysine-arginine-ornithine-binding protein|uniref:ABC transporter substrate-binding protein n=1 Tax=Paraburkholderia fungorum TaxID=134537 RepID=A0AAP5V104_9BURK|nr:MULTISPECIES: ABC transporter substrate-binding protein [Burkholderiaceae]MDT8843914.1 ABC transporter substrate-binding protein [Paraburkholderia fungorum]